MLIDLPSGFTLFSSVSIILLLTDNYCEASHIVLGTKFGKIIGEKSRLSDSADIYSFRGIPYANPLSNIFGKATKVDSWYEPRKVLKLQPACLYTPFTHNDQNLVKSDYDTSADCLYLNIYTPSIPTDPIKLTGSDKLICGDAPWPVMVYFPNDVVGQGFEPLELSAWQKLVVVVVNYRVGPLGYTCAGDIGNRALGDQKLALSWIQDTIHAFHGDPARVTIFANGEAAVDASLHLFTSDTEARFARIWLSSLDITKVEPKRPGRAASDFLRAVGCDSAHSSLLLECLGDVPVANITQWYHSYERQGSFRSCVDGIAIATHPLALYSQDRWRKDVDVVIGFPMLDVCDELMKPLSSELLESQISDLLDMYGVNSDMQQTILPQLPDLYELFDGNSLRVKLCEVMTDIFIATPSAIQADFHSGRNSTGSESDESDRGKVYMYELSHRLSAKTTPIFVDATRGDDLQSLLGIPCSPRVQTDFSRDDCEISKQMMSRAANFLRTGNPNSHNTMHMWPEYYDRHLPETRLLSIRDPMFSSVVRNYKEDQVKFWRKYVFDNLDLGSATNEWMRVDSASGGEASPYVEEAGGVLGEGGGDVAERDRDVGEGDEEEEAGEILSNMSTEDPSEPWEDNPKYEEEGEDDFISEEEIFVLENNNEEEKSPGSKVYEQRKDEL